MIFSVEAEYDQKFIFFSILELLHFFSRGDTIFFQDFYPDLNSTQKISKNTLEHFFEKNDFLIGAWAEK